MTKIRQSAKYECKKQDKSLYCFKLDEHTGIITKEESGCNNEVRKYQDR